MGLWINEETLQRAVIAADRAEHARDLAAYEATYLDDTSLPAEVLAAMLTECMRSGSLQTPLPVPGWRDTLSTRRGPAPVAEIVGEEVSGDDALMARVLKIVGRAMATDPEARAVVAEVASKYGSFHGGKQ